MEISEESIGRAIDSLKLNKAGGIDELGTSLLRHTREGIIKPLLAIYQKSFEGGEVPMDWRLANVTPIFKKWSKGEARNYRPVSLTCHGGKIFEKLLKEKITKYLEENRLIYESQHGFRRSRSRLTNLLEFMEYILEYVDKGESVDVIFLDLQKAFYKVPHARLLEKVKAIGIDGKILRWIGEWLNRRKQRVVLNGSESEWIEVTSGVPQGSVLGPILFLIFINDIDECIKTRIWKFADDTKVVGRVGSKKGIELITEDLLALVKWCQDWQMVFNVEKCKVMHFGHKNVRTKYEMNGIELTEVKQETDLGVVICDDLKVGTQCYKAAMKGNQILGTNL